MSKKQQQKIKQLEKEIEELKRENEKTSAEWCLELVNNALAEVIAGIILYIIDKYL